MELRVLQGNISARHWMDWMRVRLESYHEDIQEPKLQPENANPDS